MVGGQTEVRRPPDRTCHRSAGGRLPGRLPDRSAVGGQTEVVREVGLQTEVRGVGLQTEVGTSPNRSA
eukprot:372214-Amphidinium_carterae.1